MNDLDLTLASGKKMLFMAHMIAGYPSASVAFRIAESLVRGGADIVELQIPFSDPMADGPTIAVACDEALKKGTTVAKSLALLKKISRLGTPVAVMSYINPIFRYGIPKFVKKIKIDGACALIVPDCPFDTEEGRALLAACIQNDIYLTPVVSPGVPKKRLEEIATHARGFVYCTSRQGITGAGGSFGNALFPFIKELKRIFDLPIAVGFGVQSKEDVRMLSPHSDIVIAGSVFVKEIGRVGITRAPAAIETLMRSLIS